MRIARIGVRSLVAGLWLLAVAGCSGAYGNGPSPNAPALPWFYRIQQTLSGGDVGVIASSKGVVAVGAQGDILRLNSLKVEFLAVDVPGRSLWMVLGGNTKELWVQDLESIEGPVRVASGLDRVPGLLLRDETRVMEPSADAVVLQLDLRTPASPRAEVVPGDLLEGEVTEEDRAAASRVSFESSPVLDAVLSRSPRPSSGNCRDPRPGFRRSFEGVICEDEALCGTAEPVPHTPFFRVIVRHDCGDLCHVQWALYRPTTGTWHDAKDPLALYGTFDLGWHSFSEVALSQSGESYVLDGSLYGWSGEMVEGLQGSGGGFLTASCWMR